MAWTSRAATNILVRVLRAEDGLTASLKTVELYENLDLPEVAESQILAGTALPASGGRGSGVGYPHLRVYCERIENKQLEKFRRFSGSLRMVVEITVSGEKADDAEESLQAYAEAVTDVLERNRGDWGQGFTYGGNYRIDFDASKSGGRNYIQTAKVHLEVDASQPFGA